MSGEMASELNASKAAAMEAYCRVCPRLSCMTVLAESFLFQHPYAAFLGFKRGVKIK